MDGLHGSEHGHSAAPRGYLAIKALAKEHGCPLETLLALAKKNDPFYCGAPAHVEKAVWFADVWRSFAHTTAVHVRRVHYQLVSQPDPRMHDGTPYQNTERCLVLCRTQVCLSTARCSHPYEVGILAVPCPLHSGAYSGKWCP
jgi:hypothetical protein